jgi:hypothetical protein
MSADEQQTPQDEESLEDLEDLFADEDDNIPILEETPAKRKSDEPASETEQEEYIPIVQSFPDPYTMITKNTSRMESLGEVSEDQINRAEAGATGSGNGALAPDIADLLGIDPSQKKKERTIDDFFDEPESPSTSEMEDEEEHPPVLPDSLCFNYQDWDQLQQYSQQLGESQIEPEEEQLKPTKSTQDNGLPDDIAALFDSNDLSSQHTIEQTEEEQEQLITFPDTYLFKFGDPKRLKQVLTDLGAEKDFSKFEQAEQDSTGLPSDIANLLDMPSEQPKRKPKKEEIDIDSFFDDGPVRVKSDPSEEGPIPVFPDKPELRFTMDKNLRDMVKSMKDLGKPVVIEE